MLRKTLLLLGLLVLLSVNFWTVETKEEKGLQFLEKNEGAVVESEMDGVETFGQWPPIKDVTTNSEAKPKISFKYLKWQGELEYNPPIPASSRKYWAITYAVYDNKTFNLRPACWHTDILNFREPVPKYFRYSCYEETQIHNNSYLALEVWMNRWKWDYTPSLNYIKYDVRTCDYYHLHYWYPGEGKNITVQMIRKNEASCGYP